MSDDKKEGKDLGNNWTMVIMTLILFGLPTCCVMTCNAAAMARN